MKNIIKAIGSFIGGLFKKVATIDIAVQLPADIAITPQMIDHLINVVNIIKRVVNNPVAVLVTDLTPIALDNEIRLKIADALPAILAGLTYSKNYLNTDNKSDAVNGMLEKVRLADDPDKDALYHALLGRLIVVVSDGKVTWSEAVSIIEVYFKQVYGIPQGAPAPVTTIVNPANGYQPSSDVANPIPPLAEPAPVTIDTVNAAIQAALSQATQSSTITQ